MTAEPLLSDDEADVLAVVIAATDGATSIEEVLSRMLLGLHARVVVEPPGGWLLVHNSSIRLTDAELALVTELIEAT